MCTVYDFCVAVVYYYSGSPDICRVTIFWLENNDFLRRKAYFLRGNASKFSYARRTEEKGSGVCKQYPIDEEN